VLKVTMAPLPTVRFCATWKIQTSFAPPASVTALGMETPETLTSQIAAGLIALILIGLAFRGVVGFVHSRRPKRYPDSVMVPREQPPKPPE